MAARSLLAVVVLVPAGLCHAGDNVRLRETYSAGDEYRVSIRVDLSGTLRVPVGKDGKKRQDLQVSGNSAVDYHERVLSVKSDEVRKTVRNYKRMEFSRKTAGNEQQSSLRDSVRRLVVIRHKQMEVPFSPDGPLLWGEIDLIRTDVFAPALVGLMPDSVVSIGDQWRASDTAIKELTDLQKIDSSQLVCKFQSITNFGRRRFARVSLAGKVQGLGEDGKARHDLDGFCLFDLDSKRLSYLSLQARHALLDPSGKELGVIKGTFVLTREPKSSSVALSDSALRGLSLEPNDDNTRLLFDDQDLGVRFLYPRRWRVSTLQRNQVSLDEPTGGGLLITLEPLKRMPSGQQFQREANAFLTKMGVKILQASAPRKMQASPGNVEHFSVQAKVNKQRVQLDYFIARQTNGGATIASRLLSSQARTLEPDVQRIVRSLEITRQQ